MQCENLTIMKDIEFSMIGSNKELIKCDKVFGKELLWMNALSDKGLAKAYWKLDENAFNGMAASMFMKLDTLILGGYPFVMFLPKEKADKKLVKDIAAEGLEYVPIGFLDLHKISENKFTTSGLGIAKPYQGKGLSKYLIYAALKTAGAEKLIIPTQLSNSFAHYAWLHLGELEVKANDVFHEEADTIVYSAKVPENLEEILKPLKNKDAENGFKKVPFNDFKKLEKGDKIAGYKNSTSSYLLVKEGVPEDAKKEYVYYKAKHDLCVESIKKAMKAGSDLSEGSAYAADKEMAKFCLMQMSDMKKKYTGLGGDNA